MERNDEYIADGVGDDGQSNSELIENSTSSIDSKAKKKRRGNKKYKTLFCSSCWRDEGHIPLVKSVPVIIFLTILTLGTYLLFRTYKCRLCGNERMASGE